uniref:Protein Nef n=1 Tax=Simian immunodeficiency virus TaxID=11723 RepID=Q6VG42_SIV|nr:nef protein [Simian immunodeficiency virus]
MGSKSSKQPAQQSLISSPPSPGTGRKQYFKLVEEYGENSWLSPDASGRGRRYSLTEGASKRPVIEEHERTCPVRPRVPIRDPTYKLMVDMSHFLKEKGGLEGMFVSTERLQKLETWAYVEWGIIPGWLMYTDGPGTRYPKIPGFLWCLREVAMTEGSEEGDDQYLLDHPAFQGREEDHHKQFLVFSFCSRLALKSGLQLDQMQQEERKKRLATNHIL